jgi:hypothetical protein
MARYIRNKKGKGTLAENELIHNFWDQLFLTPHILRWLSAPVIIASPSPDSAKKVWQKIFDNQYIF